MASPVYVFFDVDDTLVQWRVHWTEAFALVAKEAGVEVTNEQSFDAINTAFSTFYTDYLGKHSASGDEEEFWLDYDGRIFEMLGVTDDPRRAAARVYEVLTHPDAIQLFPEVVEVLDALKDRGARLGIITGRPVAAGDLEALGVLHYFDPVLDGLGAGEAKQVGSSIFEPALEAVEAAGAVGWHVGDSYEHDVQAALAAGLRGVLVDRRGTHPDAECDRVTDLRGLLDLVDGAAS